MSKGSKVVPVRFSAEELEALAAQMQRSEGYRRGEPWSVSEFVRIAVREKLGKMKRSRAKKRAARVPLGDEIVTLAKGGA